MQHCNHFRIKKIEHPFHNPEPVRASLYTLFGPLKPHQQYRWGRIFAYQETVTESMEKECDKNNLNQVIEDDYIFWTDKQDNIKCTFTIVYDPSNIDTFIKLYSKIIERNIRLTYCIVNQFPDGRYEFDIFRLSEMSYLEHYNRVRPSGSDLYKLYKRK